MPEIQFESAGLVLAWLALTVDGADPGLRRKWPVVSVCLAGVVECSLALSTPALPARARATRSVLARPPWHRHAPSHHHTPPFRAPCPSGQAPAGTRNWAPGTAQSPTVLRMLREHDEATATASAPAKADGQPRSGSPQSPLTCGYIQFQYFSGVFRPPPFMGGAAGGWSSAALHLLLAPGGGESILAVDVGVDVSADIGADVGANTAVNVAVDAAWEPAR